MELQPLLHDLLVAAAAPTQAWSAPDGQVRAHGAQGVYEGDVRVLAEAVLTVGGREPEVIAAGPVGTGAVEVLALARAIDEPGADPTVRLRRRRHVVPGRVTETVEVASATTGPVHATLEVRLRCDLAEMEAVKVGRPHDPVPADDATAGTVRWSGTRGGVTVESPDAVADLTDPTAPVLRWDLHVAAGGTAVATWAAVTHQPADAVVLPAVGPAVWSVPELRCDDRRLPRLLAQALEDLDALRMRASFAPEDTFLAAGAPWFFTLFGRDSIWAARMMLPLGTELAAGTLRTLAARQGREVDPATAEQPGKILHELRAAELDLGDGSVLPPLYYGTVDATPLWVCLLHDAWRWGMPAVEVEALLPALEAALAWMSDHGDADGDGFLEYLDESGRGLANQGWKDSGDSVQWRDGRLATGPIALCEVQGYAHEAAVRGADLLDAFGRPGGDAWRAWAGRLADRFRSAFWVEDAEGAYPAIALDADKRPVDSLTSNIGHLLGTGLLTPDEEALVARRLASPALDSGYGLRTMSTHEAGYWPLRYHGGSVWPHDTAIVVSALARAGHLEVAGQLAEGLLTAASELGYRLPELLAGDARGTTPHVAPYPAACRPQAWSAASAVALLGAVLGLEPDAPSGVLTVSPATPSPVGALDVTGLRFAGSPLDVRVTGDGGLAEVRVAAGLQVLGGSLAVEVPAGP